MTENIETYISESQKVVWAALSEVGKVRQENEDSFFISEELCLFIISDGMGGHRGGRLASKIVVDDLPVLIETGLHKLRSQSPRAIRALLKRSIIEQNRHLYCESHSETGYVDMGATLVALLIKDGWAYVANVGDSPAFRFRNQRLRQISQDHTVVSELIEENKIDTSEADDHPAQGQITQYMGMSDLIAPHVRAFRLNRCDCILLCSDGLTDMLSVKDIRRIIKGEKQSQAICQNLVKAANAAGGQDNITVVYVCT